MASQQRRRWSSLGSFVRQAPPPTAPTLQKPVARPVIFQVRPPAPPPTPPKETAPNAPPPPPGVRQNAATGPRSLVPPTPTSAPSNETPPPKAPPPPTAPPPRDVTPAAPPQTETITKSNPTSPLTKSLQISANKKAPPAPSSNIAAPQSTQFTPISHPPSPLKTPHHQPKKAHDLEPKISPEFEQETNNNQDSNNTKIFQNGQEKDANKKVMILSSVNRGASMELSTWYKNGDFKKLGNEEERSSINGKGHKPITMQAPAMRAFINSNVQGVNNSVLCNSSCTQKDPGVRLSFTRKANGT